MSPPIAAEELPPPKELLDLSLEPPLINTHPGPQYQDEARTAGMIIGMDRTPKGRIWACWVGNGDSANGWFSLATSDDDGATWSKPRLVIEQDHDVSAAVAPHSQDAAPLIEADVSLFANKDKAFYRLPSLLVTSKGTVLAACQERLGRGDDFAPSSLVLRRSLDGGKMFEPEQTLYEHTGDCTFNGNLVEDRETGTIFACFIAFPQDEHASWFAKKWVPQGGGFAVVKSTDDGKSWSAPIEIVPKPNADGWHGGGAFNNNHGIQLRRGPHAGRLVIGARVFKPGVYEGRAKGGLIYSDDHGESWHVG
ncbi:MAG TPA: sialidase family protein, partial [Chthoniobacteraceae bacterium]|nr:sialidase family protein [Chthoniobacteraceae bacterium]